ncbi:hypothetical protein LEP1GSC116_1190 [Leptospira interrogans serovar Icterohaemorrhagiae str. Verdun HP]|uniref:Uncharacterized protein n=2 Tax=Leptospira interrogans TaxID=173 RepID=M6RM51_LEPIR|nr:hypothetical protein LEP1GSC117_2493 [Leptospira interrogans serovar Icterohaemorrhagiae str. Verdun LP]EMG22699.1 hypothetical protein LEP1GSC150_3198 [Leptospira interrogans serovar Copenhageni str. LT2050]EMO05674.1 hypothetical protein LEP1GSC116_1190 [Leptospira interrogans serovar Icterohaemorrhagiae str. Verdun HP]
MFQKLECRIYFEKANNFRLDTIFKNSFIFTKSIIHFWNYFHTYTSIP